MYTQVGLAGEGSKQVGSGATGVQREGQTGRPRRGGGILVVHLPGKIHKEIARRIMAHQAGNSLAEQAGEKASSSCRHSDSTLEYFISIECSQCFRSSFK